jgi:hypothetical protein
LKIGERTRTGHVGALGRLKIWSPFKPIFFKNVFNIYLIGEGRK